MMRIEGSAFVESCLAQHIPFLGCMRPNSLILEWYRLNELTIDQGQNWNKKGSEVFVVKPYNRSQPARYFELVSADGDPSEAFETHEKKPVTTEYILSEEQRSDYTQMLREAIYQMKSDVLGKVVLSLRLPLSSNKPFTLLIRRLFTKEKKDSLRHLFSINDGVIWVGDTPETLLTRDHNFIKTEALAGTRRLSELRANEFTFKEFEEQGFIVEELKQRLSAFVEEIHLSDREQVLAGTLTHLKTTLSGSLKEIVSDKHLLDALHPTAAVCGFPRTEALALIEGLEKHNRELYTGYIGFRTTKKSTYFVNLRCARLDAFSLDLFVGAGITASSVIENETDEIQSKTAAIMGLIAFNGGHMQPVKYFY
jgi:isochorismate synthase